MSKVTPEEVLSHLKLVPVFRSYSRGELKQLAAVMTEETVWAGTTLIEEGKPNHRFFIVLDGEVEIAQQGKVVRRARPGTFFGEISLMELVPATASAISRTSCSLMILEHQAFLALVRKDGRLGRDVNAAMEERR
ncbi:MAG: cyclic nucleotide-binding domain-containing protein [Candidatus Dormibacteria bacterium]